MTPRNLLLISFDTLRFDAASAAPDRRLLLDAADLARTPTLDRIISEGTFFARAVTSCHRTSTSHASILTGTFWPKHGVLDLFGFPMNDGVETLGEGLQRGGYRTAQNAGEGRRNGRMFDSESTRLNRGYDFQAFGGWMRKETLRWLSDDPRQRPWFLFWHTMAVHAPYGVRSGKFRAQGRRDLAEGRPFEGLRRLYLRNVSNVDRRFGKMWERLKSAGLLEDTLVVIMSDHGEGLSEHGHQHSYEHGWEEGVIRVPIIMWCPGLVKAGQVIEDPVSSVDVAPTIAELLEVDWQPPGGLDGRSLAPIVRGEEGTASLDGRLCAFFSIMPDGSGQPPLMQGMVRAWMKYVSFAQATPEQWTRIKNAFEAGHRKRKRQWRVYPKGQLLQRYDRGELEFLFDLWEDPFEQENLALRRPSQLAEFRQAMADWHARNRPADTTTRKHMSDAEEQQIEKDLRALGYLD